MSDKHPHPTHSSREGHGMRPTAGRDTFLGEIVEQPEALRRAARSLIEQVETLGLVAESDVRSRPLLLTGMGSSYHACLAAASMLGRGGVLAVTANAAELLHFRRDALTEASLVVIVSQSGQSVEVVRLAEEFAARGRRPPLAAITNGTDNPLASTADISLDTAAGEEVGPSTKSYAATFVPLRALVAVILGSPDKAWRHEVERTALQARQAADAAAWMLRSPEELADDLMTWMNGRRSLAILGRGVARGAAETSALVLKEAARFPVEALDAAEFRHGPLELADPNLAAVLLSLEEGIRQLDRRLAEELARHGAAVMIVGDLNGGAGGTRSLGIGRLDPLLSCAVAVIPAQLLSWRLAVAGGWHPGEFLRASKVTTRE